MNFFYVCQNKTYNTEKELGCIWSPQKTKSGGNNKGYNNMTNVAKGDVIFHYHRGAIKAISVAQADFIEAPSCKGHDEWDGANGFKVNCKYTELSEPLDIKLCEEFIMNSNVDSEDGPFTKNGTVKQLYISPLPVDFAKFFINKSFVLQKDTKVIKELKKIRDSISNKNEEKECSYNEKASFFAVEAKNEEVSRRTKDKKKQKTTKKGGGIAARRDERVGAQALKIADFKCQSSPMHKTFIRKSNGTPYVIPHHLIPLEYYDLFEYSIDVVENVVAVCSFCHDLLHHGRMEDKKLILQRLYDEKKDDLKEYGIDISFEQLLALY